MKTILCIMAAAALLSVEGEGDRPGKVESMIRGHIERCEADGLGIPVVQVAPKLFDKLVGEVGWKRVLGKHGHRRWVIFETPDPKRNSGKRYIRVEQYPTPKSRIR